MEPTKLVCGFLLHVYFNTSYFNMFFAALEFSQREVGNKDPMRQFCFHGSQQRLATAEFQHVLFLQVFVEDDNILLSTT